MIPAQRLEELANNCSAIRELSDSGKFSARWSDVLVLEKHVAELLAERTLLVAVVEAARAEHVAKLESGKTVYWHQSKNAPCAVCEGLRALERDDTGEES